MQHFFIHAAFALLAVPAPATSDPVVAVERIGDSGALAVRMHVTVDAPLAHVERVLLETTAYPDWVPRVRATRAFQSGRTFTVFESDIDMPWPLDDVHETVRMERRRSPHGVVLAWRHLRGDLRQNEGEWTLRRLSAHRTDVSYAATFELSTWIPMFLIRRGQEQEAPWIIEGLRKRATWYAREVRRRKRSSI